MGKHLCFWEGRKTGERSVGCEPKTRQLLLLPVTYREAVLGHGDAAGLHGDAHALPDAVGKAVRLGGSLTAVPRGAPGTHGHTSAHTQPLRNKTLWACQGDQDCSPQLLIPIFVWQVSSE